MPARPKQTDPERLVLWAVRREALGARIRALRIEAGLSQEALGLEAGVSRNMVIGIEWGKRGILAERLVDIATALGVTVTELLRDGDSPRPI